MSKRKEVTVADLREYVLRAAVLVEESRPADMDTATYCKIETLYDAARKLVHESRRLLRAMPVDDLYGGFFETEEAQAAAEAMAEAMARVLDKKRQGEVRP